LVAADFLCRLRRLGQDQRLGQKRRDGKGRKLDDERLNARSLGDSSSLMECVNSMSFSCSNEQAKSWSELQSHLSAIITGEQKAKIVGKLTK
jgi:hypothetical protein